MLHAETSLTSTPSIETCFDVLHGAVVAAIDAVRQHEELLEETSVTRAAARRVAVPVRILAVVAHLALVRLLLDHQRHADVHTAQLEQTDVRVVEDEICPRGVVGVVRVSIASARARS